MKTKIKFILIALLFISVISSKLVYASLPLSGQKIFIDIGHGGADPGTISGNIYEKDIVLKIGLELKNELIKSGASVILIRDGDYDLAKPDAKRRKKSDFDNRIKLINESKADYYISLHLNYLNDSKYYGPQVFYNDNFLVNSKLAASMQKNFNESLKNNREIKKIPSRTYMYSKLQIPGILIECGFLSNYKESKLLVQKKYQNKLAKIIVKSLSESRI